MAQEQTAAAAHVHPTMGCLWYAIASHQRCVIECSPPLPFSFVEFYYPGSDGGCDPVVNLQHHHGKDENIQKGKTKRREEMLMINYDIK